MSGTLWPLDRYRGEHAIGCGYGLGGWMTALTSLALWSLWSVSSPALAAEKAQLPGVALEFDVSEDAGGAWTLGEDLPAAFVEAGVQAGWTLLAVDGIKMADMAAVRRALASGPARTVQLEFDTPQGPTVLVVQRSELVRADTIGVLPWPAEFVPGESGFSISADGPT